MIGDAIKNFLSKNKMKNRGNKKLKKTKQKVFLSNKFCYNEYINIHA